MIRDWLKKWWTTAIGLIASIVLLVLLLVAYKKQPGPTPRIINFQSYNVPAPAGRESTEYLWGFITPDGITVHTSVMITRDAVKDVE